nr:hypothetical protein [Solirubrobacterales bacterium]
MSRADAALDPAPANPEGAVAAPALRNFLGGRWVAAGAAPTLDDLNPATGELLAMVPLSGAAEVDQAVTAAAAAQP